MNPKPERAGLEEVARELAYTLGIEEFEPETVRFLTVVLRLLVQGRPVSPEELATALNLPRDQVTAVLEPFRGLLDLDEEGNVVGFSGLSVKKAPHRFEVGGTALFTWCALDALGLPILIGQAARVQSADPVSGEAIQLTVGPEELEGLNPADAVVSLVFPDPEKVQEDVRGAFCHNVSFYSSPQTAAEWASKNPAGKVLSVAEVYEISHILMDPFREMLEE